MLLGPRLQLCEPKLATVIALSMLYICIHTRRSAMALSGLNDRQVDELSSRLPPFTPPPRRPPPPPLEGNVSKW